LKRLGTVQHLSGQGYMIVRGDTDACPGLNSIVLTKEARKVGKLVEVFGPVSRPYFSVEVFRGIKETEIRNLQNEKVYLR